MRKIFSLGLLAAWALPLGIAAAEGETPNYRTVFPQSRIPEFKIVIEPADWAAMQANMRELFGDPGQGMPLPPVDPPRKPGEMPDFPKKKPMWVKAKVVFEGTEWPNVAVRYKGNSSLFSSWFRGSEKLPFKIDFEKFIDSGKRKFHGFQELSLSNNFADDTYLREPLAYRVLGEMGQPASHTALYRVVVDNGTGAKDYGLYTAIEVTSDTVVKRFFGEEEGNLYEGEGSGTTLAKNVTPEKIESSFEKENNKKKADWSDVHGLHALLHDPRRLSDPAGWRADLTQMFHVPGFLQWLAFGSVMEHWDAYGAMAHNFYLYNEKGKLQWISWDHNLILGADFGPPKKPFIPLPPGEPGKSPPGFPSPSFARTEVTEQWPLIRFLLDDPVINQEYQGALQAMRDQHFDAAKIEGELHERAVLIRASLPASAQAAYDESVNKLVARIHEREQKLAEYLAGPKAGN